MLTSLLDLVIMSCVAAVAAVIGWWLHGSGSIRMITSDGVAEADIEVQLAQARRVIPTLHNLAVRISTDVDAHSDRVEKINQDLISDHGDQEAVVMDAMTNLLASNEEMQQQLASAKGKLQEQAREVRSHAEAARTDALTQVANRRAFDDELAKREIEFCERGEITSLVMIDIDHFKQVNDTHGHQAGDEILQGIARVLRHTARESDFVARYGGEEFAIIQSAGLTPENKSHVQQVCEAIANARFRSSAGSSRATASFGIAQLDPDESIASLINRSDMALFAAKQAGRNRVHLHDGQESRPLLDADDTTQSETPKAEPPVTPDAPEPVSEKRQSPSEQQWPAEVVSVPEDRICNRTAFCNALGRCLAEWKQGGPMPSVLLIQIDKYRGVLATHGEKAGPPVLDAASRFLVAGLSDADTIADYDLGTYAILLPSADRVRMVTFAERLRAAIAKFSLQRDGRPLRFTISAGGSEPLANDSIQTHLQRIEGALSDVVAKGGNRGAYYDGASFQPASQILEVEAS